MPSVALCHYLIYTQHVSSWQWHKHTFYWVLLSKLVLKPNPAECIHMCKRPRRKHNDNEITLTSLVMPTWNHVNLVRYCNLCVHFRAPIIRAKLKLEKCLLALRHCFDAHQSVSLAIVVRALARILKLSNIFAKMVQNYIKWFKIDIFCLLKMKVTRQNDRHDRF